MSFYTKQNLSNITRKARGLFVRLISDEKSLNKEQKEIVLNIFDNAFRFVDCEDSISKEQVLNMFNKVKDDFRTSFINTPCFANRQTEDIMYHLRIALMYVM